jgi:hypothetical protein
MIFTFIMDTATWRKSMKMLWSIAYGRPAYSERATFQQAHRQWVGEALTGEMAVRDDRWSEAIAVGSLPFVDKVKSDIGAKALHREVAQVGETYTLREQSEIYGGDFASENDALMPDNTIPWEKNAEYTET